MKKNSASYSTPNCVNIRLLRGTVRAKRSAIICATVAKFAIAIQIDNVILFLAIF